MAIVRNAAEQESAPNAAVKSLLSQSQTLSGGIVSAEQQSAAASLANCAAPNREKDTAAAGGGLIVVTAPRLVKRSSMCPGTGSDGHKTSSRCSLQLDRAKQQQTRSREESVQGIEACGLHGPRGCVDHAPGTDAIPRRGSLDVRRQAQLAAGGDAQPEMAAVSSAGFVAYVRPLLSSTILATFAGIVVALCPPLHAASQSAVGRILLGGMSMLGAGTVPMTLLILGCNLMADDAASLRPVEFPRIFVVIVVLVRLFVIPAVFFALQHVLFLANALPDNKVFRLTVLVESCAPTAINVSVICSLFAYRTRQFSRVLFIIYTSSIVSTTLWLVVYLWYLGD
jgi:hypothetical protein